MLTTTLSRIYGVRWPWVLGVYLGLAVSLLHSRYGLTGLPDYTFDPLGQHTTRVAPNCYRVVELFIVGAGLGRVMGERQAACVYLLVAATACLAVFHAYLRNWLTVGGAFGGACLMAATWPLSMKFGTAYPGDFLEVISYCIGLWLLLSRRYWWLPLLIALATLNRESTLFIVAAVFAVAQWRHGGKRALLLATACAAAWAASYFGVRLAMGYVPYFCDVWRISHNAIQLWGWVTHPNPLSLQVQFLALFGVLWVLGLLPLSERPPVLVRMAWMVPAYFVGAFMIAIVSEGRVFLGLATVLVPLGLWNLLPDVRSEAAVRD